MAYSGRPRNQVAHFIARWPGAGGVTEVALHGNTSWRPGGAEPDKVEDRPAECSTCNVMICKRRGDLAPCLLDYHNGLK